MSGAGDNKTLPECADECRAVILRGLAERGVEATVTWLAPMFPSGYESLDMRCPHGVLWFTEPTSEQVAQWAKDGVA